MNKVYVAARYPMITEARAAANLLKQANYEVTSRWLDGVNRALHDAAIEDLEDVRAADYLMLLTLPEGTSYSGGGRHVEFGYALALGKRVIAVGHYETLFCYLPQVRVYPTVGAAINFMNLDHSEAVDHDRKLWGAR